MTNEEQTLNLKERIEIQEQLIEKLSELNETLNERIETQKQFIGELNEQISVLQDRITDMGWKMEYERYS